MRRGWPSLATAIEHGTGDADPTVRLDILRAIDATGVLTDEHDARALADGLAPLIAAERANARGTTSPRNSSFEVVEAMSGICDLLDTLKVGLEDRGWQPTLAAQAAIQVGGPVILAGSLEAATHDGPNDPKARTDYRRGGRRNGKVPGHDLPLGAGRQAPGNRDHRRPQRPHRRRSQRRQPGLVRADRVGYKNLQNVQ